MFIVIHLLTFATSLVIPAWFLVIVLAASAAVLRGLSVRKTTYQEKLAIQKSVLQHACAEEAEKRRQARILVLQKQLKKLENVVRDTDEVREQEYRDSCEERGEEYEMPEPLEGAREFALEILYISKGLSAISDVSEPLEFYQKWVNTLQHHITSWDERRRAILCLENLQRRLNALEKTLQYAHGVETRSPAYSSIPVRSHQDLFNVVVVLHEWLDLKLTSKTADLMKEATQFTLEVEYLESQYKALNRVLTSYETTALRLQEVASRAWDDVIACTFESDPDFLEPYYQESLVREESAYAQAYALALRGDERKAVEHGIRAFRHWGFSCALHAVMYKKNYSIGEACKEFQVETEAKIPFFLKKLKLKRVMDTPA